MIGITMGDPRGVGPEIIVKALAAMAAGRACARPRIFGNRATLEAAAAGRRRPDSVSATTWR